MLSKLKPYLTALPPLKSVYHVALCVLVAFSFIATSIYFIPAVRAISRNLHASLMPRGGELDDKILPKPVQTAVRGLRQLGVREYWCVGVMCFDGTPERDIHARMVEGAWPIRFNVTSRLVVGFAKDFDKSILQCSVLWEEDGVRIAQCIR